MVNFFKKVRAVLSLLEAYSLRVAKCFKLIGATLNMLKAQSTDIEEEMFDVYDKSLMALGEVEEAIKGIKDELKR